MGNLGNPSTLVAMSTTMGPFSWTSHPKNLQGLEVHTSQTVIPSVETGGSWLRQVIIFMEA